MDKYSLKHFSLKDLPPTAKHYRAGPARLAIAKKKARIEYAHRLMEESKYADMGLAPYGLAPMSPMKRKSRTSEVKSDRISARPAKKPIAAQPATLTTNVPYGNHGLSNSL